MGADLSIVIVNWNVAELLAGCLRSLPAACGEWWPRAEVLVVDNASTDESVEMVRRDFPGVRLITLRENVGFGRGNNVGIRATATPLMLLLNPDTVCHPLSIENMANYMQASPDVGIAGPRLLNPDGTLQPSRRLFPTVATALVESTLLQPWFGHSKLLRAFYMLDRPDDEVQDIGWLSGAALVCRRQALQQAGPFDPGYFMFSEEVDLCKRVSDAGWRVVYLPEARVTHFGGQSTEQDVPARHLHFSAAKARYFARHEGPVAGNLVRVYLLATYAFELGSEAAKWLAGHKRPLRASRIRAYLGVLRSGLRERPPAGQGRRVLMITGEYPPARGGVGDYTCRLSTALAQRGLPVRVVTRRWSEVGDRGPVTPDASPSRPPTSDLRPLPPMLISRITIRRVLRALRRSGSGLAHIQYQTGAYEMRPRVNFLPLVLRRAGGRPVVVTFHDLLVPYLFPKAGPVRMWVTKLLARTASAAIATNPQDAARLRSWGVRRVEVIPIGANILRNPPPGFSHERWRSERGLSCSDTLLAYFGFLNSSKGLDDLLRALAALRGEGKGYRLVMVGGGLGSSDPTNRETARRLDALAEDLGVQDALAWTGFLASEEVSAALLSADIAVLPYSTGASFRRGSLMAALEHGLPVITTTPPAEEQTGLEGWPALVDGENALLVPAGDPVALAAAIRRLAGDPALRSRLSAGAGRVAHYFSWERIAEMHLALYARLVGAGDKGNSQGTPL